MILHYMFRMFPLGILVLLFEEKSVGEFSEVNSRTAVGDEEDAHLQTLFWNVSTGASYFCRLRRNPLGNFGKLNPGLPLKMRSMHTFIPYFGMFPLGLLVFVI